MADILEIIVKLTDRASPGAKNLGKTLTTVGKDMMKVGGILSATVTAPIVALGVKSIMAASDVSESMNKVRVVFGDLGDEMVDWSETAASALGMTQNEALQAVGTYGNLFRAMGLTEEASSGMSKELVQLASDLASFNNMDPTEVLEKLRAGLTGETEPLKSLGVNLNQAAIEAKAMELGLVGANEELTAGAKAQAAYALIMEQTALAHGDFARTSDGLANSMRIVKAMVGDLFADLGSLLLPIVLELVTYVKEALTWFQNLSPEMQKIIVIGLGIAAALGPLIVIVGSLITAIGAIIPVVSSVIGILSGPLLLIIAAVGAAIFLLYTAWTKNWGGIQQKTQAVIQFIRDLINAGLKFIRDLWQENGDDIMFIVNALWDFVKRAFETGKTIVTNIVNALATIVNAIWQRHGDTLKTLWENTWNMIKTLLENAKTILSGIIAAIRSAIEGDWRGFGENLRKVWDAAWNSIKTILSTAWKNIQTVFTALIKDIKDIITKTDWVGLGKKIIDGMIQGLKNGYGAFIEFIRKLVKDAWEAIKGFFGISSPSKLMMYAGKEVMRGFILGMQGMSGGMQTATVGAMAGTKVETNFHITANYPYQSPRTLKTDIQQLNALYGRGRV